MTDAQHENHQHRSTRTAGNDPVAGADPGGTRSTHPGQPDKRGAPAVESAVTQHVSSGDRNPARETRGRKGSV
jgi:hypothetical protein